MSMLLHFTQLYCMLLYMCWWSIKVCDDNIYQVLHALSEIICFQKMVFISYISTNFFQNQLFVCLYSHM